MQRNYNINLIKGGIIRTSEKTLKQSKKAKLCIKFIGFQLVMKKVMMHLKEGDIKHEQYKTNPDLKFLKTYMEDKTSVKK